jgi:hypothetical protein
MVIDGLMIGMLRAAPNSFLTDFAFDPYLNSIYYTWYQMWADTWSNTVGNGVEAAVSSVLALRVARSVIPSVGIGRSTAAREGQAADPFAEPDREAVPESAGASPFGSEALPADGELA